MQTLGGSALVALAIVVRGAALGAPLIGSFGCNGNRVSGGPQTATLSPLPSALVSTLEPSTAQAPVASTGASPATSAPPPPAPPSPIDGALPSPDAFGLSVKASCPGKTCRLDRMIPDAVRPPPEDAAPAFVWEQDLASGTSVSFPKNSEFDVLGVTLAGTVTLIADEAKEDRLPLAPWRAFLAPGAGITIAAKAGAARVVLVVATSGESVVAPRAAAASVWRQRPAPLVDVDLTAEPDLAWAKGAYHARIGFAEPASRRASLGVLRMSAEAPVAAHRHEKEWEHMAILQGEGDFIQGSPGEERSTHAKDGTTVSVPPAIRHEWRPARSRPFLGIQLYTPPGPEQRFKKLATPP